jgi:predicted MFS family arabinose efflux permease
MDTRRTAAASPPRHCRSTSHGPSGVLTLLMAATAGLVVANIYYNQPILNDIAATFKVGPAAVAWLSTATQLGYAGGLLLVVPLGDGMDRKWLIIGSTLVSSAILIVLPVSPNLPCILGASFALGFASVAPQLMVPYAAGLVPGPGRGKVVGTVMSGLLIGILLSRTLSGLIGSKLSWQAVYWLAGGVMFVLAFILWTALPSEPPHESVSYGRLFASLPKLLRSEPIIRRHSILGALGFGSFSAFWTTLAFYLQSRPQHYGPDVAGMFGLLGVTGALVAPLAGHLGETWAPRHVNGLFFFLIMLAFVVMLFSEKNTLIILGVGVLLLDAGAQGSQIANQGRIYTLDAGLHSRLNSIYLVSYFIAGSIGSFVGAQAWAIGGWNGVCATGILLSVAALVFLWTERSSLSSTMRKEI